MLTLGVSVYIFRYNNPELWVELLVATKIMLFGTELRIVLWCNLEFCATQHWREPRFLNVWTWTPVSLKWQITLEAISITVIRSSIHQTKLGNLCDCQMLANFGWARKTTNPISLLVRVDFTPSTNKISHEMYVYQNRGLLISDLRLGWVINAHHTPLSASQFAFSFCRL